MHHRVSQDATLYNWWIVIVPKGRRYRRPGRISVSATG